MHRQASLTVALSGRVTGSWFLTISAIFLMIGPPFEGIGLWFRLKIYRFYLGKGGMNFPIANAFKLRKLLLCRFDCLFGLGADLTMIDRSQQRKSLPARGISFMKHTR
jgi:hypothetical protein